MTPVPRRRAVLLVLGTVVACFVLIAPTLTWLEFSSGTENLNVATALETRREQHWMVPTLEGEPRVAKPPLTAWMTAASIREKTMDAMSSADPARRAAAEPQLAWQVRFPFLLSACLMLLATAELGRVLSGGDWRVAAIAAAACGSNLFFLRHMRLATTDVQLALWVAVTNVFLAHAVMGKRPWRGAIGVGVALGLAFLSKGPVALVQTVAPLVVFLLADYLLSRRRGIHDDAADDNFSLVATDASPWGARARTRIAQVLLGAALFLLIALPWYAIVASKYPDVWQRWQLEVTREGATDLPANRWYNYLSFFLFIAPWTAFFIAGIVIVVRDLMQSPRDARSRGMWLALLMTIVPIVIMSFFRDRKERYLLPMIAPASVIVARAVVEHFQTRHLKSLADRAVVTIHWLTLLIIAIGLPIAGGTMLKTLDGARWYSPTLAALGGAICVAIVIAGMIAHRRCGGAIVAATLLCMLAVQMLFMHGYRNSREGRSEMKPLAALIWQQAPDAQVFTTGAKRMRAPTDLSIYLNRSVLWVDDVSQIPASSRPAVLVVRERKKQPPPVAPEGATVIGKTARDEGWWHAFLLRSDVATTRPASGAAK
ncbi:MAG: hypothetical protein QOF78_3843 [Phycisphaerales bacterium]|nr:hypothetical protein [Phycisphaerales bacterium]